MENQSVIAKLKKVLIGFLLIATCGTTVVHAEEQQEENNKTRDPNSPYLEMYVRNCELESNRQILVELKAYNITSLQGLETIFTYNSEYLQPSYLSGENQNKILNNINSIKYGNRPSTKAEENAFDATSKEMLLNSFSFDDQYIDALKVTTFRYMPSDYSQDSSQTEYEKLQIIISRKDLTTEISTQNSDEPILLGTFSFNVKDIEGESPTELDKGSFNEKRVKVICDDNKTEGEYSTYKKDIETPADPNNLDDCTELLEFVYKKYGSISGTVEIGHFIGDGTFEIEENVANIKNMGNIANISIYDAKKVKEINWNLLGFEYTKVRNSLHPLLSGELGAYNRLDLETTPEIEPDYYLELTPESEGKYTIKDIIFGEYVVVITREDYGDYIYTGLNIGADNKDVELGLAQLIAGDLNKDGKITNSDRQIFMQLYLNRKYIEQILGRAAFDIAGSMECSDRDRQWMLQTVVFCLKAKGQTITAKQVIDLSENSEN